MVVRRVLRVACHTWRVDASQQPRPVPPAVGGPGAALPDERIAHNETVARSVNEAIEAGRVTRDGHSPFICECGQLGCNAVIEMTLVEYVAVRADGRRFVVAAGHEAHFDEPVADAADHRVIVKRGAAGRIAEEADPRAEDPA
jgi:hypothetical protein